MNKSIKCSESTNRHFLKEWLNQQQIVEIRQEDNIITIILKK